MARTARAVQSIPSAGLSATYSAPDNTNGESIPNNGATVLHVKNTGGSPVTVTLATPGVFDGNALADRAVSVIATTGDKFIPLGSTGIYSQPDGTVSVDYSTATGVLVAALTLA